MPIQPIVKLSALFNRFFNSGKLGGLILVLCTCLSVAIANSPLAEGYIHFWHSLINLSFGHTNLNFSIEHWINDGLMTLFFLMVGLEIERELYVGELSRLKDALLPVLAAVGGMLFPAAIHFAINRGTYSQSGVGIPMATDIAFSLGVLSVLGKKVPLVLKVFLTAVAIIDDLGAIVVIAIFYTRSFSFLYLLSAIGIFAALLVLNRLHVYKLWAYLAPAIFMWYFMEKSGVHATISGVLLAFAIPFRKHHNPNLSAVLLKWLHRPVNYFIVPLFALANTAIPLAAGWPKQLISENSLGIMAGLLVGKPVGILLFSGAAVRLKFCNLPPGIDWKILFSASVLAGIGFTMSIFISNLAFAGMGAMIENSKVAVLVGSVAAASIGLTLLYGTFRSRI
jgi:Na+:H+ antiporter, NhaA family